MAKTPEETLFADDPETAAEILEEKQRNWRRDMATGEEPIDKAVQIDGYATDTGAVIEIWTEEKGWHYFLVEGTTKLVLLADDLMNASHMLGEQPDIEEPPLQ